MLIYATLALCLGFLFDLVIGDPPDWPHLIRWIGALIAWLEKQLYPMHNKRLGGAILCCTAVLVCFAIPAVLLWAAYAVSPWLYVCLEAVLCWQIVATKSLQVESGMVYAALQTGDVTQARTAVSMIVGRDTAQLDSAAVTRAAVETVAENASDGVVAPLFYAMLGGGAFGCLYKAVNTMDSMIGYKNERYLDFGRFAAKLDDLLSFVPARLSAMLMIAAAWLGRFDARNAYRIWKRDRFNHASPNSAQTEAAVAGALHVRLAGDAYYFGELHAKPYIGDDDRPIEPQDILRAHKLLRWTAWLMLLVAVVVRGIAYAAV